MNGMRCIDTQDAVIASLVFRFAENALVSPCKPDSPGPYESLSTPTFFPP
ncbi:MAG: hypothetical protein JWO94_3164 [Verrucomicrobiaceae bacterium]|nr:hypothetical protein [Verrucomicrobiaceae bacterium]